LSVQPVHGLVKSVHPGSNSSRGTFQPGPGGQAPRDLPAGEPRDVTFRCYIRELAARADILPILPTPPSTSSNSPGSPLSTSMSPSTPPSSASSSSSKCHFSRPPRYYKGESLVGRTADQSIGQCLFALGSQLEQKSISGDLKLTENPLGNICGRRQRLG